MGATAARAAHIGGRIGKVHTRAPRGKRRERGEGGEKNHPRPRSDPKMMENIFHARWSGVEREDRLDG